MWSSASANTSSAGVNNGLVSHPALVPSKVNEMPATTNSAQIGQSALLSPSSRPPARPLTQGRVRNCTCSDIFGYIFGAVLLGCLLAAAGGAIYGMSTHTGLFS